jgi:hypothetical protein
MRHGISQRKAALVNSWERLGHLLTELGNALGHFFSVLGEFLWQLHQTIPFWPLVVVWLAWWLGAVNWRKVWPVLASGGWTAVVLLALVAALGWSQLAKSPGEILGFGPIPNFWWQLADVTLLVLSALLCGWLQGVFGWTPAEVNLEPPGVAALTDGHEHPVGTLHGHEAAHSEEPH